MKGAATNSSCSCPDHGRWRLSSDPSATLEEASRTSVEGRERVEVCCSTLRFLVLKAEQQCPSSAGTGCPTDTARVNSEPCRCP